MGGERRSIPHETSAEEIALCNMLQLSSLIRNLEITGVVVDLGGNYS